MNKVINPFYLAYVSTKMNIIPKEHIDYLLTLKNSGFEPKVIYDIGCCVLHWTRIVKQIWPDAEIILFDAFEPANFLYEASGYKYNICVLGDVDGKQIKYYQNLYEPCGNSYYKEKSDIYFKETDFNMRIMETLDNVVKNKGFPLPDFIKIDVQGCEKDIILGGKSVIKNAKHLIIEMQSEELNIDAPKVCETSPIIEELGFELVAPLFCKNIHNGVCYDGDYHYKNKEKYITLDNNYCVVLY